MDKEYEEMQKGVEAAITCGEVYVRHCAYKRDKNKKIINNLKGVPVKGKVFFVMPAIWMRNEGVGARNYISKIVENPTWLQICVLANQMIITTKDKHHIYLEGVRKIGTYYDDVSQYTFKMGS
jgi:hypothetical protein